MKRSKNDARLYFIAILTPNHISNEITAIKQYFKKTYNIKKALNSPPHITLYPPFRWRLSEIEILNTSVRNFARNYSSFPINIKDFGAFRNRVIYAGVTKNDSLQSLWYALTMWMMNDLQIGEKPDKRGLHPHITVAFRDLSPEIFKKAWPKYKNKSFEMQFIADHLALLRHTGKHWEVVRLFPLQTNNP